MSDKRRIAREIPPEELDREAQITPRDEIAADESARIHGSALFNALLDAKVEEPDERKP